MTTAEAVATGRAGESSAMQVLQTLLDIGAELYACRDRDMMLATVLRQARSLIRADAGSLYLVQRDRLKLLAAQNDRMSEQDIAHEDGGLVAPLGIDRGNTSAKR